MPHFLLWPPGGTVEKDMRDTWVNTPDRTATVSAFLVLADNCRYGSLHHGQCCKDWRLLHLKHYFVTWAKWFLFFLSFVPPTLFLWPFSSLWFPHWEGLVRSVNKTTLKKPGPGLLVPFPIAELPQWEQPQWELIWLKAPDYSLSWQGSLRDRNLGRWSHCIHSWEIEQRMHVAPQFWFSAYTVQDPRERYHPWWSFQFNTVSITALRTSMTRGTSPRRFCSVEN